MLSLRDAADVKSLLNDNVMFDALKYEEILEKVLPFFHETGFHAKLLHSQDKYFSVNRLIQQYLQVNITKYNVSKKSEDFLTLKFRFDVRRSFRIFNAPDSVSMKGLDCEGAGRQ